MLPLVTSANVACGFHAGDPTTLRRTCALAVDSGVMIGAPVGYRDLAGFGRRFIATHPGERVGSRAQARWRALAGFGRRFIDMDPVELTDDVLYQIGALEAMARVAGSRVAYVKPHGALYNTTVHSTAQARAVVEAVSAYDP